VSYIEITRDSLLYFGDAPYPGRNLMESIPPTLLFDENISDSLLNSLSRFVDKSIYLNLKSYYDCHDCFGQCGTWIEVEFSDKSKKITYDPDAVPGPLKQINLELNKITVKIQNIIRQ
jgi:hypothetical protein